MKAIVIGGGIGGTCVAIALKKFGIETEVLKQLKRSNRWVPLFQFGQTVSSV